MPECWFSYRDLQLIFGRVKSKENWLLNKNFKPVIDNTQRDQLLTNWHKAIHLALLWKDI